MGHAVGTDGSGRWHIEQDNKTPHVVAVGMTASAGRGGISGYSGFYGLEEGEHKGEGRGGAGYEKGILEVEQPDNEREAESCGYEGQ